LYIEYYPLAQALSGNIITLYSNIFTFYLLDFIFSLNFHIFPFFQFFNLRYSIVNTCRFCCTFPGSLFLRCIFLYLGNDSEAGNNQADQYQDLKYRSKAHQRIHRCLLHLFAKRIDFIQRHILDLHVQIIVYAGHSNVASGKVHRLCRCQCLS